MVDFFFLYKGSNSQSCTYQVGIYTTKLYLQPQSVNLQVGEGKKASTIHDCPPKTI